MTALDRPDVILCGWQDVKTQLLTNYAPRVHGSDCLLVFVPEVFHSHIIMSVVCKDVLVHAELF